MKHKALFVITLSFFLLINTSYYWESLFGTWLMLVTVILFLIFIFLAITLIYQVILAVKGKSDQSRLILISTLIIVLSITILKPRGIINFEKFEDKDLLIAEREGVAGCFTIMKLKENGTFYIRESCFGVDKNSGTYNVNKDTVRFKFDSGVRATSLFTYAIIKLDHKPGNKALGQIDCYKNPDDTTSAITLSITQNDLEK